jgi:hypothetical protein
MGVPATETAFRTFADSLSSPAAIATLGDFRGDTLTWTAELKEYRFVVQHASGALAKWRCIPSPPDRARPFVVCGMSITEDATSPDEFLEGLTFDRPPS